MEITASLNVLGVILIVWTEPALAQSTNNTCIAGETQILNVSPLSYSKTKTSPKYPQHYDDNTECSWHIKMPSYYSESYVVKVVFNDFNLAQSSVVGSYSCQYMYVDSLTFYDGATSMSKLIGAYCGITHPDVIYSTGQSLYVKFHAVNVLNDRHARGFSFIYSAVKKEEASAICHPSSYLVSDVSRVNGSSGTFFSPEYPVPYPDDAICIWIITVPHGKRVKLWFESFELQSSFNDCHKGKDDNDFVEIRDGQTSVNFEIGRYCDYNTRYTTPADLFSSGRYMWVRFRSGQGHKRRDVKGFKAHFEAVDQTADINSTKVCFPGNVNNYNLKLAGDKGTLKSPLDLYPPDMNCSWVITVLEGNIVKLTFNRFQLDLNNMGTCGDYVEVLDGRHTSSKKLGFGKYCGDARSRPGTFRSSGRYMRVTFVSDSNDRDRYKGFEATFQAVGERNTAHVMMALGLGISAGVMLLILMVVCLVCNSKRKKARNRAVRDTGMSMTTASTLASQSQQLSPPPSQAANQPANSPYPTPQVGYAPVSYNSPPPAYPYPDEPPPPPTYPYPDEPPPPYPGEEVVPQFPPPGQNSGYRIVLQPNLVRLP